MNTVANWQIQELDYELQYMRIVQATIAQDCGYRSEANYVAKMQLIAAERRIKVAGLDNQIQLDQR